MGDVGSLSGWLVTLGRVAIGSMDVLIDLQHTWLLTGLSDEMVLTLCAVVGLWPARACCCIGPLLVVDFACGRHGMCLS